MRLIRIGEDGSFSLADYSGKILPSYGILSHTWLQPSEEVTFKDMIKGRGREKSGYRKITFCAERARKDSLRHIWIDTCCIDKSQGPELGEALNSMYKWYQKADKCYVYLTDVRCDGQCPRDLKRVFQRCRWLTRGWTLQELIAPKFVEFYNANGDYLGDRRSLCDLIVERTHIPRLALTGTAPSEFSVNDRLSWMENRKTTKEEDRIYALLGVLGVVMNPIYGEGYDNALTRLKQEILQPARMLEELLRKYDELKSQVQQLRVQYSRMPGCGSLKDLVRIDDGLSDIYYLPSDLCETPERFREFLTFKFSTNNLPGLPQLQWGHILAWDWNEKYRLRYDTWTGALRPDKGIKISFVMGAVYGPPRKRCIRCYKPREAGITTMAINSCGSCNLAVRWVDPDYVGYEPQDQVLTLDSKAYRDYRTKASKPARMEQTKTSTSSAAMDHKPSPDANTPTIEFVCRRLTMKWEPVFNLVHRYQHCRCIIWLSTPSAFVPELTFLEGFECPRHNIEGISRRDYSWFGPQPHIDPYFNKYGGYNAFWAMLCECFPQIYEHLNGKEAITEAELMDGYRAQRERRKVDPNSIRESILEYWFENMEVCRRMTRQFPQDIEEHFLREKQRRIERGIDKPDRASEHLRSQREYLAKEYSESVMAKEIKSIAAGKWDGIPHWKFRDCDD